MLPTLRRNILKALIGCVCCIPDFGFRTARADYGVAIDPATQYQTFEGWGTSLCWFANVLGGAPPAARNSVADLLFDSDKGLGLNVVRYNIGGGENPAYHSLQFRAAVPGFEAPDHTYNWQADANQRWFLQAAIARGADQLEAFSNSPPYWMTHSGSVSGSKDGSSDNLNPAYYAAFADYLATVAQKFQTLWHVTFRDVEPFNECSADWWRFGGRQEGCHFDRSTQNTIVKELGALLARRRMLTGIAASDENSIDEAVLSLASLDDTALPYLSRVNTHSYNGRQRIELKKLTDSKHRSLCMSEYGDGDGSGMTMSEQILADMRQLHPSAWVYWQALDDSSAPGWGMIYSNLNHPTDYAYTINEKYYVMANYSKFIRPGYKLIFDSDSQSLVAYSQATGVLVIVTTNNTDGDANVTYDLSGFSRVKGPVAAYRTSASEHLESLNGIALADNALSALAKAHSVTTYVIQGATYSPPIAASVNADAVGTGLNRFRYSGSWRHITKGLPADHNNYHMSARPNDTAAIQFEGTQLLLYGTMGPDCGIVAMSIDGGPEEERDLAAQSQTDHTLLYVSPTLPRGLHTLKVRVTGRAKSAQQSPAVMIDRADIVSG